MRWARLARGEAETGVDVGEAEFDQLVQVFEADGLG